MRNKRAKNKLCTGICLCVTFVLGSCSKDFVPYSERIIIHPDIPIIYDNIYLNEIQTLTCSQNQKKYFKYTSLVDHYFVLETFGQKDTSIQVTSVAMGTVFSSTGGTGNNAKASFKAYANQTFYIQVYLSHSNDLGSFDLQMREQKFSMFGYVDDNGNSTLGDLTIPYNLFSGLFNCEKNENVNAAYALIIDERFLQRINSDIVFFTGHGGPGVIAFYDGSSYLNLTNFLVNDLSCTKVSLWAACQTAAPGLDGVSFSENAYLVGSKSSIGFNQSISFSSSTLFSNSFFSYLSSGCSVSTAISFATFGIFWSFDPILDYEVFGDPSVTVIIPNNQTPSFLLNNKNSGFLDDGYSVNVNKYTTRYYELINGLISNSYVDITTIGKNTINLNHVQEYSSILDIDEAYLNSPLPEIYLTSNFPYQEKRHNVYYNNDGIFTPFQIIIVDYELDGMPFQDIFCRNLHNGNYIDYIEIAGDLDYVS